MNTVAVATDPHPTDVQFRHQLHPLHLLAAFGLVGLAGFVAHSNSIPMWTLAIGIIGPDLSFLAAIGAPNQPNGALARRAVRPYNAMHHPIGPLVAIVTGFLVGAPLVSVVGLAWLSHLAWDRGLGYGLRNADGTIRAMGQW